MNRLGVGESLKWERRTTPPPPLPKFAIDEDTKVGLVSNLEHLVVIVLSFRCEMIQFI